MSTERVDVLAVMDALIYLSGYRLKEKRRRVMREVAAGKDVHPEAACKADRAEYLRDEAVKSRAALVELIEAAWQASATLGHAYHTVLDGQLAEYAHADYQRLDAALARIGAP